MRLRQAVVFAASIALAPVALDRAAYAQNAAPAAPQKLTFPGDVALWTVAIKPDKTAAFEQIMKRVGDALAKSSIPSASGRLPAGRS